MKTPIARAAASKLGDLSAKKRILTVGGVICLAAWAAFAVGLVVGVGTATQLVLLTVALLITEGLFWLAAALLGITVIQLRRKLFGRLLPGGRSDAA